MKKIRPCPTCRHVSLLTIILLLQKMYLKSGIYLILSVACSYCFQHTKLFTIVHTEWATDKQRLIGRYLPNLSKFYFFQASLVVSGFHCLIVFLCSSQWFSCAVVSGFLVQQLVVFLCSSQWFLLPSSQWFLLPSSYWFPLPSS